MSKCPACGSENPPAKDTCYICGCNLIPIKIRISGDVDHPVMCITCGSKTNLEKKTDTVNEPSRASIGPSSLAVYHWPYYQCEDCKKIQEGIYHRFLQPDEQPKEKVGGRSKKLFNISVILVFCLLPILLVVAIFTKLWAICWTAVPVILFSIIASQIRDSQLLKYGRQVELPRLVKELGHPYHPFYPSAYHDSLEIEIYCHEYAITLLAMNPLTISRMAVIR